MSPNNVMWLGSRNSQTW